MQPFAIKVSFSKVPVLRVPILHTIIISIGSYVISCRMVPFFMYFYCLSLKEEKMRKLLLLSVIVLSAGLVFAGGQGESADGSSDQVNLRFSWWGGDTRHKATLAAIEAYEAKNPNVKIEAEYGGFDSYYQKLVTQLAGGTAADVVQIDYKWVHDLAAQGEVFVDMNTLTDKIDMSGFDMKFTRAYGAHGDYLLGLPTGLNAFGLTLNSPLLKDAGIPVKESWTWQDILDYGSKVRALGEDKYLMGLQPQHFWYVIKIQLKQKTGNNFIKDDLSFGFEKQDLVEVLEYIDGAFESGAFAPLEETVLYDGKGWDQIPNWLNGSYGMISSWASVYTTVKNATTFDMTVARFPIPEDAVNPGLQTTPSQLLAVNSRSANKEEAIKFIDWFFNSEEAINILKDCRGVPPTSRARDILAAADELDTDVVTAVNLALPYSGGPENGPSLNKEIETIVKDYVQQVGYKVLTPEEAATQMMEDLEKVLSQL